MSIPSNLSNYLSQRGTRYEVCLHGHSHSSAETARSAQVSPSELAKSVLLEDDMGCVMAVIPADKAVAVDDFADMLGRRHLKLVPEARIATLFNDCERGAIPPVGMAWGITTVIDDDLEAAGVVYMEGGDHETLLRMSHDDFHELMRGQPHGHFCEPLTH